MTKRRRKPIKAPATIKVKEVVLPPAGIVRVVAPPGVVPVVAVDPVKRVVEIVPVPVKKKTGWWEQLFGL